MAKKLEMQRESNVRDHQPNIFNVTSGIFTQDFLHQVRHFNAVKPKNLTRHLWCHIGHFPAVKLDILNLYKQLF